MLKRKRIVKIIKQDLSIMGSEFCNVRNTNDCEEVF